MVELPCRRPNSCANPAEVHDPRSYCGDSARSKPDWCAHTLACALPCPHACPSISGVVHAFVARVWAGACTVAWVSCAGSTGWVSKSRAGLLLIRLSRACAAKWVQSGACCRSVQWQIPGGVHNTSSSASCSCIPIPSTSQVAADQRMSGMWEMRSHSL